MAIDLTPPSGVPTHHELPATPETCYWGYIDRDQAPVLEVEAGAVVDVQAVTHHSGDAPDLLMDDGIRAIWEALDEPWSVWQRHGLGYAQIGNRGRESMPPQPRGERRDR